MSMSTASNGLSGTGHAEYHVYASERVDALCAMVRKVRVMRVERVKCGL